RPSSSSRTPRSSPARSPRGCSSRSWSASVPSKLVLPQGPVALPAQLTDEWLAEYRENRWLGLGDTSQIQVANPFHGRTKFDIDNPHVFLLDYMRKPE